MAAGLYSEFRRVEEKHRRIRGSPMTPDLSTSVNNQGPSALRSSSQYCSGVRKAAGVKDIFRFALAPEKLG